MKKTRKTVAVSDIDLGERYRKVYEVTALIESIQAKLDNGDEKGLIHPPVVKEVEGGEKPYLLLAGGRRMAAVKKMGWEELDVDVWPADLTETDLRVVELEENLHRENLSWYEQAALIKEINELRGEITGKGEEATTKDAAEAAGVKPSQFYEDIKLANYVEKNPELKNAKTKTDAMKIIRKAEEAIINEEIARRITNSNKLAGIDAVRKRLMDSYVVGDFFEKAKNVPDKSVYFIELDPPYGIGFGSTSGMTTLPVGTKTFSDNPEEYADFIEKTGKECYRIARDDAWLICWLSMAQYTSTCYALRKAGWIVNDHPIIWVKPGKYGRTQRPEYNFVLTYEHCLYARKGKAQLAIQGPDAVFSAGPVYDKIHPTEKPLDLLKDLFKCFIVGGEVCMVPFLGSGNSLFALHHIGAKAFGFDLDQSYKDSFTIRVQERIQGGTGEAPKEPTPEQKEEIKKRAEELLSEKDFE